MFKDGNNHLCFECTLIDQETSLEDAAFMASVQSHCEVLINSLICVAYRFIHTSEPVAIRLQSATYKNNQKVKFLSAHFESTFSGICGKFCLFGIIERLQNYQTVMNTVANILKTDNSTFKYLLLYEVLQRSFRNQKETDDFIRKSQTYKLRSLKEKDCGLRTSAPAKQGKKETEISYIRNAFAHPEASRANALNSYTNAKLDAMTKTLIELVYEKNGCLGAVQK